MFLNSLLLCLISTVQWSGATSICDGIIFVDNIIPRVTDGLETLSQNFTFLEKNNTNDNSFAMVPILARALQGGKCKM